MHSKHTAEKTAPSVAPAKPAPKPRPGEPQPEGPVPSLSLSGLGDDSMEGLGAAPSGLSVGGPEGKEREKKKKAVDMGVEGEDPGDEHEPSDEAPFDDKPAESALSASNHPVVPSPTTTTRPFTHQAASSPTTTPPMAEGLGFTGMPYPTYGLHSQLRHLWHLQSPNQCHPAPPTPVSVSLRRVATLMTITDPLRVCT